MKMMCLIEAINEGECLLMGQDGCVIREYQVLMSNYLNKALDNHENITWVCLNRMKWTNDNLSLIVPELWSL